MGTTTRGHLGRSPPFSFRNLLWFCRCKCLVIFFILILILPLVLLFIVVVIIVNIITLIRIVITVELHLLLVHYHHHQHPGTFHWFPFSAASDATSFGAGALASLVRFSLTTSLLLASFAPSIPSPPCSTIYFDLYFLSSLFLKLAQCLFSVLKNIAWNTWAGGLVFVLSSDWRKKSREFDSVVLAWLPKNERKTRDNLPVLIICNEK